MAKQETQDFQAERLERRLLLLPSEPTSTRCPPLLVVTELRSNTALEFSAEALSEFDGRSR